MQTNNEHKEPEENPLEETPNWPKSPDRWKDTRGEPGMVVGAGGK